MLALAAAGPEKSVFLLHPTARPLQNYCKLLGYEQGADVYFVELQADLAVRLERNESEFRLAEKASKRELEKSRERLLADDEKYKLNSHGDFFYTENYLKIGNTNLSAAEAARRIVEAFAFATLDSPTKV